MLTDDTGRLCGIFTDSDLARLFEQRRDAALDRPIQEVMTVDPITVVVGTRLVDAVELLSRARSANCRWWTRMGSRPACWTLPI